MKEKKEKKRKKVKPENSEQWMKEYTSEWEFFTTHSNENYVKAKISGGYNIFGIENKYLVSLIKLAYKEECGCDLKNKEVNNFLENASTKAKRDNQRQDIGYRVAQDSVDNIYVDLMNTKREIIKINASGWSSVDNCPIHFSRPNESKAIATPDGSENLELLRNFINLDDDDYKLLLVWLVFSFFLKFDIPPLYLLGTAGSGKSTLLSFIHHLIDPRQDIHKSIPDNERDLAVIAKNSHLLCFDNISDVSQKKSDFLCKIATGGAFSRRKLYTDSDTVNFYYKKPVILSGINDFVKSPDLLDRVIRLSAQPITPEARKDKKLSDEFTNSTPQILGGLYTLVSKVLSKKDDTECTYISRMPDFERIGHKVETIMAWEKGSFCQILKDNQEFQARQSSETDAFFETVLKFAAQEKKWKGSPTELLNELNKLAPEKVTSNKEWPGNGNMTSRKLNRISPSLTKCGVRILNPMKPEYCRDSCSSKRIINIARD
jgi:energy-coupling factor transporter ATP-binding protein EcfA2